jgi:cytochrome b6
VGDWIALFLRGGEDVSGDTLTRFFGFHVCILPFLLFGLLGFHVVLIQKHGMSVPLPVEKTGDIPFWPNFVYREMRVWLVLLGLLVTAAAFFPPALGKAADLMAPAPEGIKPEWYFLFLFQTLKIFPARVLFVDGDTVAVLGVLMGLVIIFFLPLIDDPPEGKKGKVVAAGAWAFLLYAVVMTVWSLL